MRLTQQTDYSIRILIYCAAHPGTSRIRDIARTYGISELNLFKIMRALVDNGFIESIRGRNGGIRLAKPAAEIRLGAVVRATEANLNLTDCFLSDNHDCLLTNACGFNGALREALAAFLAVLDRYTLTDLVTDPVGLRKILAVPTEVVAPSEAVALLSH